MGKKAVASPKETKGKKRKTTNKKLFLALTPTVAIPCVLLIIPKNSSYSKKDEKIFKELLLKAYEKSSQREHPVVPYTIKNVYDVDARRRLKEEDIDKYFSKRSFNEFYNLLSENINASFYVLAHQIDKLYEYQTTKPWECSNLIASFLSYNLGEQKHLKQ